MELTQQQFGVWAALAIHDTSSVVAACQIYGDEALKIGLMLKLTRALWIIPLTLIFSLKNKNKAKLTYPWFILFFLLISLLFSLTNEFNVLVPYLSKISKTGLSLTLFLIGLNLSKDQLREIGPRPIFFGAILWVLTLTGSLFYVIHFVPEKMAIQDGHFLRNGPQKINSTYSFQTED
jgi:uncharacterized membrane protein YadS